MAYTTIITVTHDVPVTRLGALGGATNRSREAILAAADLLTRLATGQDKGSVEIQAGGTSQVRGSGTITLSSASGAVGATIGGTLKTVTASGGDAATATALAAAINADTTINKKVYASAAGAVVTLKALVPGVLGNIALVASGTGSTVSGATLTGGAGADVAPVVHDRS